MLTTLTVILIFFLSVQVFPVAIGINVKGEWPKAILFVGILSFIQVLTYWLGLKLGSTFMQLMDGFKSAVFLIGFLLIGIRMLMEVFSIRKGLRSHSIANAQHVILASLAQGMNTFLAGLLFYYLAVDSTFTIIIITAITVIISTIGIILKPEKTNLALASLLYVIGGIVMIIISIYISFFIF